PEMGGKFAEKFDARPGLQLIAAQKRLQGQSCFACRNTLPQPGFQMGIIAKGIVFAAEKLVQVRLGKFWIADDHSIGGEITETLGAPGDDASNAADQVTQRQGIHEAQQISDDDLAELQTQALGIDDSQSKNPFANRLAAPRPFE